MSKVSFHSGAFKSFHTTVARDSGTVRGCKLLVLLLNHLKTEDSRQCIEHNLLHNGHAGNTHLAAMTEGWWGGGV